VVERKRGVNLQFSVHIDKGDRRRDGGFSRSGSIRDETITGGGNKIDRKDLHNLYVKVFSIDGNRI